MCQLICYPLHQGVKDAVKNARSSANQAFSRLQEHIFRTEKKKKAQLESAQVRVEESRKHKNQNLMFRHNRRRGPEESRNWMLREKESKDQTFLYKNI